MNTYQRPVLQQLRERMNGKRLFIQVLFGARQVGKTTLVLQMLKQINAPSQFYLADNVPAADRNWLAKIWDEARLKLAASPQNEFVLVIDEIQKIENWSEAVKKEWDLDTIAGRNIKVVLLGSSRLMLQQGLTESLAGRFEAIYIPHWSFSEMHDAFGWSLEQYAWFGSYPATAELLSNTERIFDYIRNSLVETSISKDIIMLTKIDKPVLLRRLFEIACTYSAKIVSLTKVQGNLQEKGNLLTLSNYLHLLSEAALITGLEKFSGNIIRRRASVPKFQVFNNILLSSMLNISFENAQNNHKLWGQIMESAVGTHLLNHSLLNKYNLYYWNENNNEVDFVLEKNGEVIALEVKSGKDSTNSGLAIFKEKFKPKHVFTIGTNGISFEDFFNINPLQLFDI